MNIRLTIAAFSALFLALGAQESTAATVTFDSVGDFDAATGGGLPVEQFSPQTEPDANVSSASRTLQSTGTQFDVTSGGTTNLGTNFTLQFAGINMFIDPDDATAPNEITVTLASASNAIGFDFASVNNANAQTRALLGAGGDIFDLATFDDVAGGPAAGFIGLIFDAPVTSFTFFNSGATGTENFRIDNLQFGNVAAVPLPMGLVLLLSGLGLLAVTGRKSKAVA